MAVSNARPQKNKRAGDLDNRPRDHAEEYKRSLPERFFLRLHMVLILLAVGLTGVVTSKLLLAFGVTGLLARYLISVTIAYGAFFLFMRMWLWYIRDSSDESSQVDVDASDAIDVIDITGSAIGRGASAESGSAGFDGFGGGGDFGGGGGGDSWGDVASAPVRAGVVPIRSSAGPSIASSKGSSSGGWGFDLDFDEGAIVLAVLAVLLLVIFGAGAYLVYQAPAILSEAVFEAMLASSLIKVSNRIDTAGFMGSLFKATRIPFIIVLVMTLIFGLVAAHFCPEATRLADIINGCPPS
jgi:hypothetical protein